MFRSSHIALQMCGVCDDYNYYEYKPEMAQTKVKENYLPGQMGIFLHKRKHLFFRFYLV